MNTKEIFTAKKLLPFILTAVVIILDQVTKAWIATTPLMYAGVEDNLVNIVHVINPGVAFSMGAGFSDTARRLLFILVPLVVIGLVIVVYFRNKDFSQLQRWSICGIIGGGLGNLIDRIFRSEGVIDFIDVKFFGLFGLERWPTFNIADAAVVICGILLIISFVIAVIKGRKKENENE